MWHDTRRNRKAWVATRAPRRCTEASVGHGSEKGETDRVCKSLSMYSVCLQVDRP